MFHHEECTKITAPLAVRCCADDQRKCEDGSPCHPTSSMLSCVELGWARTPSRLDNGDVYTCSEADAMQGFCHSKRTFFEAANECMGVGARLCTLKEILGFDERNKTIILQQQGCSFDTSQPVWTASSLASSHASKMCTSGEVATTVGFGRETIQTCTPMFGGVAAVRCCADSSPTCDNGIGERRIDSTSVARACESGDAQVP